MGFIRAAVCTFNNGITHTRKNNSKNDCENRIFSLWVIHFTLIVSVTFYTIIYSILAVNNSLASENNIIRGNRAIIQILNNEAELKHNNMN